MLTFHLNFILLIYTRLLLVREVFQDTEQGSVTGNWNGANRSVWVLWTSLQTHTMKVTPTSYGHWTWKLVKDDVIASYVIFLNYSLPKNMYYEFEIKF